MAQLAWKMLLTMTCKSFYNVDGRLYNISTTWGIISARESNVILGSVRLFVFNNGQLDEKRELYYAEREFESIIPFRAPTVWWKKVEQVLNVEGYNVR